MWDWLIGIDQWLFFLVNHDAHTSWGDRLFPAITDLHKNDYFKFIFVPWLFLVFIRLYWLRGVGLFLGLLLTLALTDLLGGQIIKPFFDRQRPVEALEKAIQRAPHYGGGSFISNHAANTMAGAVYCARYIPQGRWLFMLIPLLIGFSRIYTGVHYPSDVLGGFVVGALVAQIMLWLLSWWQDPRRIGRGR